MPQKRAKSALSSGVVVTVPHPARIRLASGSASGSSRIRLASGSSRIRQQQEDKLQNVNIAHRFRQ
jgi:hypothetical protein